MRRIVTLVSVLALTAAGVAAGATSAAAAGAPVVGLFEVSAPAVDTTDGNVTVTVEVSVTDAVGGEGLAALGVAGRPSPDPGPTVPGVEGFSGLAGAPQEQIDARIELTVPAGYMRTWPLELTAYTWSGEAVDLTAQLEGRGIVRRLASTVTAAPKAPTGLKLVKQWGPSVKYNAYATWTRPDGPVPWGNRTTGTLGCGRNAWGWASTVAATSADASLFLPCTATVRLVNDFGESPAVSATA